jgi:hypothetical protein
MGRAGMIGRFGILACALALMGCGGGANEKPAQALILTVPTHIQKAMAADFPADGKIHVQRVGTIEIKSDTPICSYKGEIGLVTGDLFSALGQSWSDKNGSARTQHADRDECKVRVDSVFIYGNKTNNRNGTPYQLVIAIWQGDAVWVGGIERLDGLRPDNYEYASDRNAGKLKSPFPGYMPYGQDKIPARTQQDIIERWFEINIIRDSEDITKRFTTDIMNEGDVR